MHSIDATDEPIDGPRLARLANHADCAKENNAKMVVIPTDNGPALCLFATSGITAGQEVRYNYGIRVPWKKVGICLLTCEC